jgi:hypothetical protein
MLILKVETCVKKVLKVYSKKFKDTYLPKPISRLKIFDLDEFFEIKKRHKVDKSSFKFCTGLEHFINLNNIHHSVTFHSKLQKKKNGEIIARKVEKMR